MYKLVVLTSDYDLLVIEDQDETNKRRADRFWQYDRSHLTPNRAWREARADGGETGRVFQRVTEDDVAEILSSSLHNCALVGQPSLEFATIADVWRWLRIKQLERCEQIIIASKQRLLSDPYNTTLIQSLDFLRIFRDALRRRLNLPPSTI
jgi:hypothetical protein